MDKRKIHFNEMINETRKRDKINKLWIIAKRTRKWRVKRKLIKRVLKLKKLNYGEYRM